MRQVDLLRILLAVTAIVVLPMLGGAVVGLVADAILRTSPLYTLIGFGAGNLVAVLGIWRYVKAGLKRRGDTEAS